MPFLRSQTREKKPRTPPHVMKGAASKSLAPITVRITADVKPKPIVAEIQVGHNIFFTSLETGKHRIQNPPVQVPASSIAMSTVVSSAPLLERKSRFPFPPIKVQMYLVLEKHLKIICLFCSLPPHLPPLLHFRQRSSTLTRLRAWTNRLVLHLASLQHKLQENQI